MLILTIDLRLTHGLALAALAGLLGLTQTVAQPAAGSGDLVIAGGGVTTGGAYYDVMGHLVANRLSGRRIGVIAAATNPPSTSTANTLNSRFGAGTAVHLDISETNGRANDPVIADLIRTCGAIYYPGGSQAMLARTMLNSNGTPTLAQQAVLEIYAQGAPIGGSSAGAAIMSDPMISEGDSDLALLIGPGTSSSSGVRLRKGLGYDTNVLYCQHHLERGRFGRLLSALARGNVGTKLGIGIAEDTAAVIRHEAKTATIIGVKGAIVIDTSAAQLGPDMEIYGALVHYIDRGDVYHFDTKAITPAAGKVLRAPALPAATIAAPAWTDHAIFNLITRLADTQNTEQAIAIDPNFDVIFRKSPQTTIWRKPSEPAGSRPTWTVTHLEVSVVRRAWDPNNNIQQDFRFDEPAGTGLAATMNMAQPGLTWSGNWDDTSTTGNGTLRLRRAGTNNNRRFDVQPPENAEHLSLVVRFAGWRFGNAGATFGEPALRVNFMNGTAAAQPGDVTAGFRIAHVAGQGVTLEAQSGGTGSTGSTAALLWPSIMEEPVTIVTRYHRTQHTYVVYYQVSDGPYVEFFRGATAPDRDSISARMAAAGDFKGGTTTATMNYLDIDRIMVARELPGRALEVTGTQVAASDLLKVDYAVDAADDGPWQVALIVSADGGETWIRAEQAGGDVGSGVMTGAGRQITWDAAQGLEANFLGNLLVHVEVGRSLDDAAFVPDENLQASHAHVDLRRFPDAPYFGGYGDSRPHALAIDAGGTLRFDLFAVPPYRYAVEGSTDLRNWSPVTITLPGTGPALAIEPAEPGTVTGIEVPTTTFPYFRVVQNR